MRQNQGGEHLTLVVLSESSECWQVDSHAVCPVLCTALAYLDLVTVLHHAFLVLHDDRSNDEDR